MKTLVFCFILFVFASCSFSQEKSYNIACVAFYNLENLFDTINDPKINDEEFLPNGANRWNTEKYKKKLANMAEVISQIGDEYTKGGPIAIGLSEIENISVLNDLVKEPKLAKSGYVPILIDGPDRRGVDVAFMYREEYFKLISVKSIRLFLEDRPDFKTRDQLLVSGIILGDTVHFIVNHWPSRSGGEKRSAPLRAAAAQLARKTVDSIMNINPMAKIIVMGDFNDNPTNASLYKILGAAKDVDYAINNTGLYNPMYNMFKKHGLGSNAYRDSWSLFDQIILSRGLLGKDRSSLKLYKTLIFNRDFLKQKEGAFEGYPFRTFVGGQFMGGYSDHFPVYVFLIKEK
ncbi:MAG: endonuclease/exonuclease/phosphatase family protein [Bacteroidales bacterium]|nr:endonuclease/exonuclease/phosphatase family protein [Bacteroidales bacterium]